MSPKNVTTSNLPPDASASTVGDGNGHSQRIPKQCKHGALAMITIAAAVMVLSCLAAVKTPSLFHLLGIQAAMVGLLAFGFIWKKDEIHVHVVVQLIERQQSDQSLARTWHALPTAEKRAVERIALWVVSIATGIGVIGGTVIRLWG